MLFIGLLGWHEGAFAQTAFPVPNVAGVCGVSGVIVTMSGGSGGASSSTGTGFPDGGVGGKGGSIVCTLNVRTPTIVTSLTYYVGTAGATGVPIFTGTTGAAGGTGYGNGGNAGNFAGPSGIVGTDVSGGGGGGSSAVLNTTGSTVLLVAGGGGGGGALSTTVFGGAGGNPGVTGGSFSPNFGGVGGTPGTFGALGGVGIAYNGMPAEATDPGNGGNGGEGLTGSQSGGGGGAGYGGGGGGGAGNTVAAGVNTVTAGGGGGSNYVNPTAVTTSLVNGTATATGNGGVTLVLYPNIASTTGVLLCTGATSTFTETTPGGTWSSSDPTIASVSATTGTSIIVTGVSTGVANISYTGSAGYYSFVTVTVKAGTNPIDGPTSLCATQTINLSDSTPGGTWSSGSPGVATISSTGVLTGLSGGVASISYTLPSGCLASSPVTVYPFPAPIGGTFSVCVGNTTTLTDAVTGGLWTSGDVTVATIDPASGLVSGISPGTSPITYGFAGRCLVYAVVTVNPLPDITSFDSTNPTTCGGSDGTITLNGLPAGRQYLVNYDYNGTPEAQLTITSTVANQVRINVPTSGLLDTGTYTDIYVTDAVTGCISVPVGPIQLFDPPNPPPPAITSSEPLCENQTLFLSGSDPLPGGTYSWTGPNGFTSSVQNPFVLAVTNANIGVYTVIYNLFNCFSLPTTATINIVAPPPLTNVTASQTILYGKSIQLNADNAFQYWWTPDNGTLSNASINDPVATPFITTTYTVYGMSQYGCVDSAFITITVDSSVDGRIPSAFSPNNDGRNDVFRPIGPKFQHLVDFRVYNRWGQEIFYSNSVEHGWDGTYHGVQQDMGDYYYQITVTQPGGVGENTTYKGSVTLIR